MVVDEITRGQLRVRYGQDPTRVDRQQARADVLALLDELDAREQPANTAEAT